MLSRYYKIQTLVENRLLLFIPKGEKKRAKQLLSEFDQRPNELTWNSEGIIFVDQVSIPLSNIYTFFPLLFKKKQPKNMPGFEDFVAKIKQMGLFFDMQSEKETKKITPQKMNGGALDAWWYIGP